MVVFCLHYFWEAWIDLKSSQVLWYFADKEGCLKEGVWEGAAVLAEQFVALFGNFDCC